MLDAVSERTLREIEQNDSNPTTLRICNSDARTFTSTCSDGSFLRLGEAIATNSHLKYLQINIGDIGLKVTDRVFFDGLKSNSSVQGLQLHRRYRNLSIGSGVGHQILKVYQENNNLTSLNIINSNLHNGGDIAITATLRCCTNLTRLGLHHCNITDEQLIPILETIRYHSSLEDLYLSNNLIGNVGCESIGTMLLKDTKTKISNLLLPGNNISDEGVIVIANSLVGNNKLYKLDLKSNTIGSIADDDFCNLLCNTTSISSIYSSNHVLHSLVLPYHIGCEKLVTLLTLNRYANKSHVATKKILLYHPDIDVSELFGWGSKEGEDTLKALPYVIDWFERAREIDVTINMSQRELSAIYQFTRAMPLLFVPISRATS